MNEHPPLEPVGDASLEARIVAWVLGEATAFEAGELERLCDERPELLVFRRRMRALHGLLSEAESAESDEAWKLPPEKRAKIEELFGESPPQTTIPLLQPEKVSTRWLLKTILTAAACVMFGMLYRFGFDGTKSSSSLAVNEKSVDFKSSGGGGRITAGSDVEIIGGSRFSLRPESPVARQREASWYNVEKDLQAGQKQNQEASVESRSYRAKAAQAVADTESLAAAAKPKMEIIREFKYPTESQLPELANGVTFSGEEQNERSFGNFAQPDATAFYGAVANSQAAELDGYAEMDADLNAMKRSENFFKDSDLIDEVESNGGVDFFAASQDEGMKLAARSPVYEPKPGATNSQRVFAEGAVSDFAIPDPGENFGEMSSLSSFERDKGGSGLGTGSGSGFGAGSGGGLAAIDERDGNIFPKTPATPTEFFDKDLTAAAGKTTGDQSLAFGAGGGGTGGAMLEADEAVLPELTKNGVGSLELSGGSTYNGRTQTSAGVLGVDGRFDTKSTGAVLEIDPFDAKGDKSPTGYGLEVGSVLPGGNRSGDAAINRNSIDAVLNNPNRSSGQSPAGPAADKTNEPSDDLAEFQSLKRDMPAASPAPVAPVAPAPAEPTKSEAAKEKMLSGGIVFSDPESPTKTSENLESNEKNAPQEKSVTSLSGLAQREMIRRQVLSGDEDVDQLASRRSEDLKKVDKAWEVKDGKDFAATAMFENPLRGNRMDGKAVEATVANNSDALQRDRVSKLEVLREQKEGAAIDMAVDAQDYVDAKRELDTAQEMLNTMKVKLIGETIQERIPTNSIIAHEDPVVEKPGWLSLDRRYQSTAAVQIKPRAPGITVLGREMTESNGSGLMTQQFFATEFEIAKSRNVLAKVAEQLELSNKWEVTKEKAVEELQKSIELSNRPGTDLIDIKVKNDDPTVASAIAAEVAKTYKDYRNQIETKDSERGLQELRKAVRDQEDKVEERRKLVTTIVRTKGIIPSGPPAEAYKIEQDKIQLESQIKSLLNYTSDQLLVYASGLDLPENNIKSLYPKYLEQKRRLDQLKTQGLGETHPTVKAESQNVANTRKQLEEGVTALRELLMNQLDMTNERLAGLQMQAPASAKSIPKPTPPPIPTDEISASGEAFSTFSLHVSDASFKVAKAALDRGERPDPESVRPEEFYNAFDYGDPTPAPGEPVACTIEQAAHPILPQRNLVRVAMRTGAAGRAASQPLNLTVLLDHSGSMEREDRHEGLNQAIVQLASLLKAGDTITVAGFSRTPRLMADRLPGERAKELIEIVRNTPSEGGTNLEEALKLGGDLALRQKNPAAQNRIVLLTDGAANLGNAKPEDLAERIRALRQQGISFDAAGLGAGGVNDRMLETLTRDGNGRYYLIDQPSDADANFAKQLAGAFRPAAENVKVQVHFNPARVGRYKLIGFEKHRLKTEDFRNDKVDAAELAAEEAGVALYQVETLPQGTGEIGEASVRFKDTSTGQMVEQTWTIPYDEKAAAFDQAAPSMQLASLAALAAEKLRGGPLAEATDFQSLTPQVAKVRAHYATSKKVGDLIEMIGKLK